jgi:outer membrane lipoprotein SlyB
MSATQKNHFLYPLIAGAVLSVTTFSCIGVAAITGHLPVGEGSTDPFFAFAPGNADHAVVIVPANPLGPMHVGLTRQASEDSPQNPLTFVRGQRIKARPCSACGVIQSIEPRATGSANADKTSALGIPLYPSASGSEGAVDVVVMSFVVQVKMSDGTLRTIYETQRPRFSVGERVRLVNGALVSLG